LQGIFGFLRDLDPHKTLFLFVHVVATPCIVFRKDINKPLIR